MTNFPKATIMYLVARQKNSADFFARYGEINGHLFRVTFQNGIARFNLDDMTNIELWAQVVEGCFAAKSNVERVLNQTFEYNPKNKLKKICFSINGIELCVNKSHSSKEEIIEDFEEELKKQQKELEESVEGYIEDKKALNLLHEKALNLDKVIELEFLTTKGNKIWNSYEKENSNHWSSINLVTFTRLWLKYIQFNLDNGYVENLSKIANEATLAANLTETTIDIWEFKEIVQKFGPHWKYGNQLENWYNKVKYHWNTGD